MNLPDLIRETVGKLPAGDDTAWTAAGLPDVRRVRVLADDPSITRADIEAACPDFTRPAVGEVAGDAPEEPATDTATETEAGGEGGEATALAADPAQAIDTEADTETDAPDAPEMTTGDFLVRGLLMAILMRMPAAMRVKADRDMLDDMAAFVSGFGIHEERMVVVEIIRSIAETKTQELPGGQYKDRVRAALEVVRGELDSVRTGIAKADDQKAGAARLARITGQGGGAPAPGAHMPSALKGATDEQVAAHERLYGKTAADGVRSAGE